MPRLNSVVVASIMTFSNIGSVAAMPSPVDTRVGGSPHQEPPEAQCRPCFSGNNRANHNGVIPNVLIHPRPVQKRAFQRARHRASQHGSAKYRGRWMSAKQLGVQHNPTVPRQSQPAPCQTTSRIHYLSWNAGSLSTDRNLELKTWLDSPDGRHVNLVAVQETHWRGPLEYTTDRFYGIHSGANIAQAGILILIDKTFYTSVQVQHREVLPGRLLHVRLEGDPCVDVVICYQHAWSLSKHQQERVAQRDQLLSKRAEFLATLATLLQSLPKRNQLLVLGDLNTDLSPEGSHVGRGLCARTGQHAGDSSMLQDLVRNHDLLALNTWGPRGHKACTFLPAGPAGRSQIDFAFTGRMQADQLSRCARPQVLPFVPATGMRHLPILGCIPSPTRPRNRYQPPALQRHKVQHTCAEHPEVATAFRVAMQSITVACPDLPTNTLFKRAWQRATAHLPTCIRPSRPDTRGQSVRELWRLRSIVRQGRKQACRTLRDLMARWRDQSALQKHQRELRKHCRRLRHQRLTQQLQEAVGHDGFVGIFRVLRLFAPKQPRRKLQLHTKDGRPMDTSTTLQTIRDFYHDLFHQHPQTTIASSAPAFQVTWPQLYQAFSSLALNKALPPTTAPARLWRLAADVLADKTLPVLNRWLKQMDRPPPEEWHIADLCLIPKPHKPLTGPEALRPISLIHPVSKALSMILHDHIRPNLQTIVADLPQMAYLEGRSVQDALDRAAAHCARVRAVLHTQRQNPHLRRQGHKLDSCRGGVLLSVDLRQAFDVMPRDRLREAMQLAQVSSAAQHVILQLHAHACLRIVHGQCQTTLDTYNGIRQGCCLAPALWVLYTSLIMTYLKQQLSMHDTTVYADDFLFHWLVNTSEQLDLAFGHIAFVIRTLDHFGMRPSPSKSAVLLGLRGSRTGSILARHVVKDPKLGRLLKIPLGSKQVCLPIVKQCPYLGTVLSYGQFEALTLKERMRQSWSAFNRLLPALRTSGVNLRHRVLTWRTCVHSVLVHGLDSFGLAPGGSTKLHKHVVRQLRILSKSPSFITREPAQDLLERLQVEDPLQHLMHRTQQRIANCRQNGMSQLQPPAVHQWWQQVEEGLRAAAHDPMQRQHCVPLRAPARLVALTANVAPRACPHCGIYFTSVRTMRIHVALKHHDLITRTPVTPRSYATMRMEYMCHSVDGLPTCRHCQWDFSSWASFCLHFEKERCSVLHRNSQAAPKASSAKPAIEECRSTPEFPTGTAPEPDHPNPLPCDNPDPAALQPDTVTPQPHTMPSSESEDALDQACRILPHVPKHFCQLALSTHWRPLAEQIKQSDLHFCILCGQWLAHPGYLSRHLSAMHPEAYRLHDAVLQWLQDRTPVLQSPCCFCGDNYKARHCSRPRHAKECPTLYRTGLILKLLNRPTSVYTIQQALQHGTQPRRHPGERGRGGFAGADVCEGAGESPLVHDEQGQASQRPSELDGCREPLRSQHCTPYAGAGDESSTGSAGAHGNSRDQAPGGPHGAGTAGQHGRQRQRQRGRQVAPLAEQGQLPNIRRWLGTRSPSTSTPLPAVGLGQGQGGQDLRPSNGSQALRTVPSNEPADHETRGPTVHQQGSGQLRDVCPNTGGFVGRPGAPQGHRGLEADEEGAARDHHPPPEDVAAEALGGPHAAANGGGDAVRGHDPPGQGDAHPGRVLQRSLSGVEPLRAQATHQEGPGPHDVVAGPRASQADANSYSAAPGRASLPHHEGAGSEYAVGSCSADAPDRQPHGRVPPTVERLLPPQPQWSVPSGSHIPSGRSHGPLSAGIGNPAHDRGHVRTLRLLNTSNFCYSNAAALAFCWIHKTGLPGAVEPLKPAMMRVIRWLCSQTRPVNLWQHVAWRAVHSGWLHPTQQHDIAEYLTYLRPQLHDQIRYGSWEARQYHDGTPQHLDEGHTWPLYLPASLTEQASLHSEPITLQHLVDRWSLSQAGLHGLTSEPPVVLIQINRFHTTSTQCHKVPVRGFPDPYLVLPKFAQHLNHAHPLELQYVTYCRATSLLHEGPQPLSGHYRAVLHDATVGDLITDDSKPAARINMSTDPQHQANCYAFLYLRCPESCSNLEG